MGRSTGISRRHKSGTGNMEKRERKTPIDFRSRNGNSSGSESKNSNESTSPVITAPSRPNQVVTNPPRTSPVQQNSSTLSNIVTTPDTQVLNSFRTGTSPGSISPVIPIALQANFVSCHQESSQTSQEESTVDSSRTKTSADSSGKMPTPSANNESHNIYCNIVDVSKLTVEQRQEHAVMLLQHYEELCNTNDPSSMFASPPPLPNIATLSQSTISSLGSGSAGRKRTFTTHEHRTTLEVNDIAETPEDLLSPPTQEVLPHNLSHSFTATDPNVFTASESLRLTAHSAQYKKDWYKAKTIRASILSAGNTPDACSRVLSIALNHKEMNPIMKMTGSIMPRKYVCLIEHHEKKKRMIGDAISIGNTKKLPEDRESFVRSNLATIGPSPSQKRNVNDVYVFKDLLGCSLSTAYRRLDQAASTREHLKANINNNQVNWSQKPPILRSKKVSNELRQQVVEWILKNNHVRESPIARDTLLISHTSSTIKQRVPKLLLECSMRQLHNELIASPEDGGLLGARKPYTEDGPGEVIISDTMLRSLAPPQLRPMTDAHKMMCGCTICSVSKYFQESLNAWRKKQLKIMKDNANNNRTRRKDILMNEYKEYAEYAFPNDEPRHPRCENAADSVVCPPTSIGHMLPNWKCVLRQCNVCTSIFLPDVELDTSDKAPRISFNTYMTQFACSLHGVLKLEMTTTYVDTDGKAKKTCLLCEQLIESKTENFSRGRFYERLKLFSIQRTIGDFHKNFYVKQIEKLVYHRNCYKLLGKFHVADIRHKAFESSPGDISTRSDYAERFSFEPEGQLQSEYFTNTRTLSMEGCCLDRYDKTKNVTESNENNYVHEQEDTIREFYLHLSDSKLQNAATTTTHMNQLLADLFSHGMMKRLGTMWDHTDGCAKQYRCSIAYYFLSFLSQRYQIVIDRAVDTPGHGKDVVDGFNAVQKRYLASCLRKRNTPEVHESDSSRMRVEAMTEEGEVSFAEECKRLLELRDKTGTTGDKKHAKREAKARLKNKYYRVYDEEATISNGSKAVYKILNNTEKVGMKELYHIRCDPDLGVGYCSMRRVPCACEGCLEQLSHEWLPDTEKTLQPRYAVEAENCKYSSILRGYNKWYITELTLIEGSEKEEDTDYRHELVLSGMSWAAADQIEMDTMGAFQTSDPDTPGYYIVQWVGEAYTLQEQYSCHAFDPPNIICEGEMVCEAKFWTPMNKGSFWYYEPGEDINVMVNLNQVVMPCLELLSKTLPREFKQHSEMHPKFLSPNTHKELLDKIAARDNLNRDVYVEDEFYYEQDNDDYDD